MNMISTSKRAIPFRGPNRSADSRDFQDEVVRDLVSLDASITENTSEISSILTVMSKEISALKADLAKRDEEDKFFRTLTANGQALTYVNGLASSEDVFFNDDTPVERRCVLDREFGELLPPRDRVYNMFYAASLDNNSTIYPRNISYNVDADEPDSATIEIGDVRNAFNGNNLSYWVRKVRMPLYADTDSVNMTLTVSVPPGQVFQPNEMYVIPFPYKGVEITNIEYSSDLTSNFKSIAELDARYGRSAQDGSIEFIPIKDASPLLVHFPPTAVAQLRITLTQQNWVEEDGYKVFYYGAQEIGLRFVDYDKTADPDLFNHEKNNNAIVRVSAPSGYYFDRISHFMSEPWDPTYRHLRWQIATDIDFTDVVWDSDQPLPQSNATSIVTVSTATSYLYIKILPLFVGSASGSPTAGSPFFLNTPAFVDAIAMQYTVRLA